MFRHLSLKNAKSLLWLARLASRSWKCLPGSWAEFWLGLAGLVGEIMVPLLDVVALVDKPEAAIAQR